MGPISTAILVGGLQALKWVFWAVAVLFLLLIVSQYLRSDSLFAPLTHLGVAGGFAVAGWISGKVAARILPS